LLGHFATSAATLIALSGPGPAPATTADELPLDLAWNAPAACPDAQSERDEVRRRVGQLAGDRRTTRVFADIAIRSDASGAFQLSLRTRVGDTTGERDLTGRDCRQLADAAALVLALLINPDAALAPVPPPPASPPSLPAPPNPAEADPARVAHLAAGIEGALATSLLPGVAAGLSTRLSFLHGPLEVSLRAGGYFPKEQTTAAYPGARASFYLLESALSLCARTSPTRPMSAVVCLGGAALRLHGESAGVSTPGAATAYWPEALAEVAGYLRLTRRARLRIGTEVRGLGHRPDFAILGLGSVYRPGTTSLRGSLGVDMLF
jgi:hypothetical protein